MTQRPLLLRAFVALGCAAVWASGCATHAPLPVYGDLPSAEELYEEGLAELEFQKQRRFLPSDYLIAIETFQDIIDNYPYSDQAVLAELAIADAYFEKGGYDEAISYYTDFADLHPEHERVPYAIYRRALSHAGQSKQPGRDQTETMRAVETLERLIVRYPHSQYTVEGEQLLMELRTRMARHDMGIGDFYYKKGEYPSAAERYRDLLNRYPGLGRGNSQTQTTYREGEAHEIFQVILDNYEGSEVADAAAGLIPAAN